MENLPAVRQVTAHHHHILCRTFLCSCFYRRSKRPEKLFIQGGTSAKRWGSIGPCVLRLLCRTPVPWATSSSQEEWGTSRERHNTEPGHLQNSETAPPTPNLGDQHLPYLKLSELRKQALGINFSLRGTKFFSKRILWGILWMSTELPISTIHLSLILCNMHCRSFLGHWSPPLC